MNNYETFLAPVEHPKSLIMKLIYFFSRKKFGKVMTPLKVFSARMPLSFGMWGAKIYKLDKKLTLPKELVLIIRHQIARLNVCEFCIDTSRFIALKELDKEDKLNALDHYQASSLYTDAEKAALDYVTKLTTEKKVELQVFSKLKTYYSEREICEFVYLVASEHVSNLSNLALNIHSDMFCDISKRKIA